MPGAWPSRRGGLVAAGVAIAAGLAVAGCSHGGQDPGASGGSSSPAATSSASPSASATSSPARTPAPLTGLSAASTADAARPAVALVLAGPDPQGLTSADVVFEMPVSTERYIGVYQSSVSATAGPVTETQPSDRSILAVLHPLLGYDGAALPYFLKPLDSTNSKVTDAGYARYPSAYTAAADGVTTSPRSIMKAVSGDTAPPQLFRYRDATDGISTLAANGVWRPKTVRVTIPGEATQDWSFSSSTDRWTQTSGGPKVQVANLVVQKVPYKQISVNRRHGISLPNAEVTGTGGAEVISGTAGGGSGGTAATGTWSKPHAGSVTNYLDSSGSLMAFQPGPTWVILAPPGTQVSTTS
jgi:Protein of unknown function (DUF3048) C-terminal domain/Protein of unknown function (DUF3048) N-terminal domain